MYELQNEVVISADQLGARQCYIYCVVQPWTENSKRSVSSSVGNNHAMLCHGYAAKEHSLFPLAQCTTS